MASQGNVTLPRQLAAARKVETRQHFFYDLTGTVRRIWDGQDFILTEGTGANSFIYYIKPPMPARTSAGRQSRGTGAEVDTRLFVRPHQGDGG